MTDKFIKLLFFFTLYHECRGESQLGQETVAQVIINRAGAAWRKDNDLTANECLSKVILAPKQFSCWNNVVVTEEYLDSEIDGMDLKQSKNIQGLFDLAGSEVQWVRHVVEQDVKKLVAGATHYHSKNVSPYWADSPSMKRLCRIGNHIFYKEG